MRSCQGGSFFQKIITTLEYYCVFLLTPGIFIIQITIVYPNLGILNTGIKQQLIHFGLISFCFINVVGNMILSMTTDSSMKQPVYGEGTYCEYCRMSGPAKNWHCMKCKACIINRDHHCNFLARCIGLHNQRYFILFLGHSMVWMVIASCYNYYLITLKFDDEGWVLAAARIFNPLLRLIIPEPLGIVDAYVFYLFVNIALIFWSGSLFCFHLRNVVMGVTSYESKFPSLMDSSKWRQNLLNVFGSRWYLAIVCPLSKSRLPNDAKIP